MAEEAGLADAAKLGGDALQSLRERVLRAALGVLAFAVPGISLVIIIMSLWTKHLDPMTLALSTYTLSFPVLRLLCGRLGFRVSAVTLLALLALTGFFVESRGGVGAGNILLNALVLLLAALFFGKRGAALGLLVVWALFVLAGLLVVHGVVPPVTKPMWDSTTAAFWWRESIALAMVGLAVTVAQVYVVERLTTEARRLEGLVAHEQQQRLALERAEREREQEREARVRTQKALEESRRIEALARMAGGIAHDFNNALTAIMGAAEEVGVATTLPEANARAQEILQAARRTAGLTRQLLTLGRRQVSQPQPVPLASLCQRLQAAFRRVLPGDVALEVGPSGDDVVVLVDPSELERALFNLVLNARDAMPQGGRLALRFSSRLIAADHPGLRPGAYVEIAVSDTGQGIAPEHLEHIYEPFFTTKAVGAGTGLGLAMVYAFAKESGGDLRVDSTLGAGTTFTLTLPRTAAVVPEQEPAAYSAPAPEVRPGTRVFVVEDDSGVRENMARALQCAGFLVTEAIDGDHAMVLLAAKLEFSVLCIDGVMPGASTSQVIERAENKCPSARVLLCSGYLREDLLRRGVAAGRYAFLAKPFSSQDLVAAVRRLVPDQVERAAS